MKKDRMPKQILIYVCDHLDDGTPVYAVAQEIGEIAEEMDGTRVGLFTLDRETELCVRRELK